MRLINSWHDAAVEEQITTHVLEVTQSGNTHCSWRLMFWMYGYSEELEYKCFKYKMLSQNGVLYLKTSRDELLSNIFLYWWTGLIIQTLSKGTVPYITTEQLYIYCQDYYWNSIRWILDKHSFTEEEKDVTELLLLVKFHYILELKNKLFQTGEKQSRLHPGKEEYTSLI